MGLHGPEARPSKGIAIKRMEKAVANLGQITTIDIKPPAGSTGVLNSPAWHHSHLNSSSILKPADLIEDPFLHMQEARKGAKQPASSRRRGAALVAQACLLTQRSEQLRGDALSNFHLLG